MDLVDLKLENLLEYDPDTKSLRGNPQILYYRQPSPSEYPLDLNKGYSQYIPRNGNFLRAFGLVQHHVMHLPKPRQVLEQMDFFLNRGTMLKFMGDGTYGKQTNFAACRFKGCIYVRSLWEDHDERYTVPYLAKTYPFKARHYVFTRSPGALPNTDAPVDERKQVYGMFSAKLGSFRLLYSAEVSGVSNKEPLGDLNDPEVLKKCQLASLRVDKQGRWNNSAPLWLMQSYLGGIDQLAIANSNERGLVCRPIEVVSCAKVMSQESQFNIHDRLQKLHKILEEISLKMGNKDNPHQELRFEMRKDSILFENRLTSIEPPGNFDQQFIDLINHL
ncbi:uncharacterized protein LOC108152259 [Drosophila miranda]|uniref:uncharacterized protein LOC108152259 n=1 Tax=Drosophila miranda TaxID=7229 RepID=UPI00143F68EB|nr:uncharacterized protein LOC108152259 [Drosophila miranda]